MERGSGGDLSAGSSTRVSGEMSLRLGSFELTRRGRPQRPPLFLFIFPFATCVGDADAGAGNGRTCNLQSERPSGDGHV